MPSERVDGMDVVAVEEATRRAAARVRAGEGPYFLELLTYRFRAHSMFDPELYRHRDEVERWKLRDPIRLFVLSARAEGALSDEDVAALETEVEAEVEQAIAFADAGTLEPIADLTKDVTTPAPEVTP